MTDFDFDFPCYQFIFERLPPYEDIDAVAEAARRSEREAVETATIGKHPVLIFRLTQPIHETSPGISRVVTLAKDAANYQYSVLMHRPVAEPMPGCPHLLKSEAEKALRDFVSSLEFS